MNRRLACVLALLLVAAPLSAQRAIQFDFNDASGAYDGTVSPAHEAGAIPLSYTTWNAVRGDAAGTLFFADGTPAPSVVFDAGVAPDSTSNIIWINLPFLGTDFGTAGIYDTPLGNDNFYQFFNQQIGVRVAGLAPGRYRVYSIGRGTPDDQHGFSYIQHIGINLENQPMEVTVGPAAVPALTWVNGATHLEGEVTVTAPTDWITVITRLANDADNNGAHAIQGLQIVPIEGFPPAFEAQVPALDERALAMLAVALATIAIVVMRR